MTDYQFGMRQLGAGMAIFVVVFVLPVLVAISVASGAIVGSLPAAVLLVVLGVLLADIRLGSWPWALGIGLVAVFVSIWLSTDSGSWSVPTRGLGFWPDAIATLVLLAAVIRMYRRKRRVS